MEQSTPCSIDPPGQNQEQIARVEKEKKDEKPSISVNIVMILIIVV